MSFLLTNEVIFIGINRQYNMPKAKGNIGVYLYYQTIYIRTNYDILILTGSEVKEVLGVGSIPVAIFPSCQDMKTIAL